MTNPNEAIGTFHIWHTGRNFRNATVSQKIFNIVHGSDSEPTKKKKGTYQLVPELLSLLEEM